MIAFAGAIPCDGGLVVGDAVFNNGKVSGGGAGNRGGEACGSARTAFFIATNAYHLYNIAGLRVDVFRTLLAGTPI